MAWKEIHAGDYGWVGRICVKQDNGALDIASFTTRLFIGIPPDGGTPKEWTAQFVTDGSDGLLQHTFLQDEIEVTECGDWTVFARLSKTGSVMTTSSFTFLADERLDA